MKFIQIELLDLGSNNYVFLKIIAIIFLKIGIISNTFYEEEQAMKKDFIV